MGCILGSGTTMCRVVFVGLDMAGKSSILHCLTDGKPTANQQYQQTLSYQQATITRGKIEMSIWDVGGDVKGRDLWRHYVKNAHAVVFVVDASDEYHLDQCGEDSAKNELHSVLKNDELPFASPLLVYANKKDKIGSLNKSQLEQRLDLISIKSRPWHIQQSCALNGNGTEEGMDWLCQTLQKQINSQK